MKTKQLLTQCYEDEVRGFSFSFSTTLIAALKQLEKEDSIVSTEDIPKWLNSATCTINPVAYMLLTHLVEQTKYSHQPSNLMKKETYDEILVSAKTFLAFLEKTTSKKIPLLWQTIKYSKETNELISLCMKSGASIEKVRVFYVPEEKTHIVLGKQNSERQNESAFTVFVEDIEFIKTHVL